MLIDNLRKVLRELDSRPDALEIRRQMTSAFNGEGPRRSNNRRPRTDLMVKGLAASPFCDHGLLGQVAAKELGLNCSDSAIFSYERYFDIAYFAGNWWEGTQRNLLVAEVENNWAELRGTIRDLLYAQSRLKWGVFYQANLEAAREEISIALRIVRADFDKAGFAE
ncbi:MAG: hypothetical protein SFU86_07610, partial [Pirellulaceae bacterium]|nr:hypothetical protein [Pirellulaceae bacterium]